MNIENLTDKDMDRFFELHREYVNLSDKLADSQIVMKEFKGECFGVRIVDQKEGPKLCHIMVEDDGNWFFETSAFSAHGLDDMILQLTAARDYLFWNKKEKK
jgi:hypothetical protein